MIIGNQGNLQSSGSEVHQFFKKITTSTSLSILLSSDTIFEIISSGVPTSDQILIENFADLNATIIVQTN